MSTAEGPLSVRWQGGVPRAAGRGPPGGSDAHLRDRVEFGRQGRGKRVPLLGSSALRFRTNPGPSLSSPRTHHSALCRGLLLLTLLFVQ